MKRLNEHIRNSVALRADFRCEYCRTHEDDMFIAFEIDHIIAQKHGGGNEISNLAYACPHCNQHKGSDLTTFVDDYNDIVPLFNPRKHLWQDHFETIGGQIIDKTKIGYATIKLLKLNNPDMLILRQILVKSKRWG